ncbi:MAG: NUDIX domain-containing protein [Bacteroidota bacterium]
MYEIYINDRPLRLVAQPPQMKTEDSDSSHLIAPWRGKTKTLLNYADTLEKGSPKVTQITLYYADLDFMWNEFMGHYKIVEAAGGLVQLNEAKRFLVMERRGHIDLPKGKIDPGETAVEAALREVSEETGLEMKSLVIHPEWPDLSGDLARNEFFKNWTTAGRGLPLSSASQPRKNPAGLASGNFDRPMVPPQMQHGDGGDDLNYKLTLHTYKTKKGKRILKPTYWFAMKSDQMVVKPQIEEDIDWVDWMTVEDVDFERMYTSLLGVWH